MKKIYSILILFVLIFTQNLTAQDCPPNLGNQSDLSTIHFKITAGTCGDFPPSITLTSISDLGIVVTYNILSCNGTNLKYQVASSEVIDDPANFIADFGFSEVCGYNNGTYDPSLSSTEVSLDKAVSIYPNPINNSDLNIKIAKYITAKVNLYNVTGKLVLSNSINNLNSKAINVSSLNNGVYMLQIVTDEASVTRKVIIMK